MSDERHGRPDERVEDLAPREPADAAHVKGGDGVDYDNWTFLKRSPPPAAPPPSLKTERITS